MITTKEFLELDNTFDNAKIYTSHIFARAGELKNDYLTDERRLEKLACDGASRVKMKLLGFFGGILITDKNHIENVFIELGIAKEQKDAN